eukprot:4795738-Amphidinium_carterae.1
MGNIASSCCAVAACARQRASGLGDSRKGGVAEGDHITYNVKLGLQGYLRASGAQHLSLAIAWM